MHVSVARYIRIEEVNGSSSVSTTGKKRSSARVSSSFFVFDTRDTEPVSTIDVPAACSCSAEPKRRLWLMSKAEAWRAKGRGMRQRRSLIVASMSDRKRDHRFSVKANLFFCGVVKFAERRFLHQTMAGGRKLGDLLLRI